MSVLKIPALAVTALGAFITLTPPQPKPKEGDSQKKLGKLEKVLSSTSRLYVASFKVFLCLASIIEAAVICASRYPAHTASQKILGLLVFGPASLANRIGYSPSFAVGCGLVTLGSYTRYRCHRALGELFTLEVNICDDHKLITHGPYAYVRHPSYTSALAVFIGSVCCYGSLGSWFRECQIINTAWGGALIAAYMMFLTVGMTVITSRPAVEDQLLRERFKGQWDAWAQRVPYRLIPFLY
ncbi:hypothetical protein IEO21_08372 [Rhodonia placenta]|uniref:Protein-S-isoprenylcysteine O-methyltransferase n=1 Tax=Rhodonia placenta TaxID=104341 RepID=A0A8H7TYW5_9APHY|nr:hypothetical protein IEO21_08372 [Postia placenta]